MPSAYLSLCPFAPYGLSIWHSLGTAVSLQGGQITAPREACPVCAGVCECGKNKPVRVRRGVSGCPSTGRKTVHARGQLKPQGLEVTATVAAKGLSEEVAFDGLGKEPPGRGGSKSRHLCLEVKSSVSSSSFLKSSVLVFFLTQKPARLKTTS